MVKRRINPPELYDGAPHGLSHGVVAPAGALLFISGQVAWDREYRVTAGTVPEQFRQALANIETVLAAAGASVADLVQLRIYVRGEVAEHMASVAPIVAAFVGDARPAVTGVGVASLASPDTLVEVEAVASVGAPRG